MTAALTKSFSDSFGQGLGHVLHDVGDLRHVRHRARSRSSSCRTPSTPGRSPPRQSTLILVNPFVSVGLGAWLYDESFPHGARDRPRRPRRRRVRRRCGRAVHVAAHRGRPRDRRGPAAPRPRAARPPARRARHLTTPPAAVRPATSAGRSDTVRGSRARSSARPRGTTRRRPGSRARRSGRGRWSMSLFHAALRHAGEVPGRAVVRDDHPVGLEGLEDDAVRARERRDVHGGLEPQPQPHRRQRRVVRSRPRGVRARRTAASVAGTVTRIAWSMTPAATSSGRTSPGRIASPAASADVHPAGRSALDREVEHRARPRGPVRRARDRPRVVELVVGARRAVDDQSTWRSPVDRGAALDPRVARDRVADPVGLRGVVERHVDPGAGRAGTVLYGMPMGPPSQSPDAEVGVQPRRRADPRDQAPTSSPPPAATRRACATRSSAAPRRTTGCH